MLHRVAAAAFAGMTALTALPAMAADEAVQPASSWGWLGGDWSLTLGASVFARPSFEGASDFRLGAAPVISLARQGPAARFSSRNDSAGLPLFDDGSFRVGVVGALIWGRDSSSYSETRGLRDVKLGGEVGLFAEYFPTDWARVRAEVRQGIRSHDGIVADLSADLFTDVTPSIQISAGPRLSLATKGFFDAWYGVNASESLASGLAVYKPGGGLNKMGVGGAITWKATDKIETQVFAEYGRLMGPAADSSLVRQRGSRDQLIVGVSATYRFDFSL